MKEVQFSLKTAEEIYLLCGASIKKEEMKIGIGNLERAGFIKQSALERAREYHSELMEIKKIRQLSNAEVYGIRNMYEQAIKEQAGEE